MHEEFRHAVFARDDFGTAEIESRVLHIGEGLDRLHGHAPVHRQDIFDLQATVKIRRNHPDRDNAGKTP